MREEDKLLRLPYSAMPITPSLCTVEEMVGNRSSRIASACKH